MAKEIQSLILVRSAHEILSDVYFENREYAKALEHYKWFIQCRDSLINEENTKKITRTEIKFEYEKKEQISKFVQEKKDALTREEKEKQKVIRNSFIGGFAILLLFSALVFQGYRNKKKANEITNQQKQEVEKQKHIIEEKQKDILDSIHYAKRIQEALLKAEQHTSQHLPEHFILFKPRDIISGDFYWTLEKQDHLYLAAADCTGHGVPGAMMSMLGIAFLNEIAGSEQLLSPAEMLNRLRDKVVKELGTSGQSKDGMDISLCKINLKSGEVEWSGANNPIWYVRTIKVNGAESKELIEIKGDKQPIGYSDFYKPFTNHILSEKNCIFYLFTDGYADQFGGEHGKKFKYKPLQQLLLNLQSKTLEEQKKELSSAFETWRGNLEQVDDVCIIGIRL
jgi:serine phosphatase RsbU (regulator of sigma subunit)